MNSYKKLFKRVLLLVVSGVILLCINGVQKKIEKNITANELRDSGTIENAPPIVAFTTVVLGAFRGVAANLLWLRAKTLQEKGSYFEMVQISTWIQQLQPKFTGALGYLGWNMAYNISVTESRFEDRWRWINSGINLLRKALASNPKDPNLYYELGWIFQHKIGGTMDKAQQYYKNQIAKEMYGVLGQVRPDWEKWAKMPNTLEALKLHYSKNDLIFKALNKSGFASFRNLYLEFIEDNKGKIPEKFAQIYKDKEKLKYLDQALRVIWLKNKYQLDCREIVEINKKYGLLDWRLPESQALYWGYTGLKVSPKGKHANSERLIIQGLGDTYRRGALLAIKDGENANFYFGPNFSVIDAVKNEYLKAKNTYKARSFDVGYFNFLKKAMVLLNTYGYKAKAREYYNEIKRMDKKNYRKDIFLSLPMDKYVAMQLRKNIDDATPTQAGNIVLGMMSRVFTYLRAGQIDTAVALEIQAKNLYLRYKKKSVDRNYLPPYSEWRAALAKRIMENIKPEQRRQFQLLLLDLNKVNSSKAKDVKDSMKKLEQIRRDKLREKAFGSGVGI